MFCMFYGCCSHLIDLSSFNTDKVIEMSYILNNCSARVITKDKNLNALKRLGVKII